MAFILRHDRRANRASRERDQYVIDDRMTGRKVESAPCLKTAENVTRFGEYEPRRQKNPSRSRECRLHTLHEAAIPYSKRTGAKFHQDDCTQMLDGVALEENVFVAAGVEPINVDVGIDDDAAHVRGRAF